MATITVDLTNLRAITNDKYYPDYRNDARFLFYYGGASSGKSCALAQKYIFRILTEQNHKFLFLRKVGRTCRLSVFEEALTACRRFGLVKGQHYHVNTTKLEIRFPLFRSRIICAGLDDPEKIKSISGITGIWMEECTEFSRDDFLQLKLRMRGKRRHYKQTCLSTNPVSVTSWLKAYFIDTIRDNAKVVHSTYKDNRFLEPDDIADIESLKDESQYHYDVYALGLWGVLGELIYNKYSVLDFNHPDDWFDSIENGLDFGFNNPSGCIKVGWKDGEQYIIDELYQRKLTNDQLIQAVKEMYGKRYDEFRFVADCAENDRIQEFRNEGFYIFPCKKGKGSVKVGIDFNKRFHTYIHPRCQNFLNEIQAYQYQKDKDGNVLDQEPVKLNDHLMDAWRYANDLIRINTGTGLVA